MVELRAFLNDTQHTYNASAVITFISARYKINYINPATPRMAIAMRTDSMMQPHYRKLIGKNVKTKIVRVSQKLLNRTLAVTKTATPYIIGIES